MSRTIPHLPDDIIHLVVSQLWLARDFGTLFDCALTAKRVTVPAVTALYRMYEISPVTNRGRDETMQLSPADLTAKWSRLWRSLILSTIGATYLPYCQYLRVLDLGDIDYLFEDSQFAGKLMRDFFKGLDAVVDHLPPANKEKRYWTNRKGAVQSIGDVICQKAPLIEEVDGNLDEGVLRTWLPRLKKLTRLQLWKGAALQGIGDVIREICPNFRSLGFYRWDDVGGTNSDQPFAIFLNDLRPQSLQSLQVIGNTDFGTLTFVALSECHGNSLTELILNDLSSEAVQELNLLKGCTTLRSLQLSEQYRRTDLQQLQGGKVFDEVVGWLRACKCLTSIKFSKLLFGAAVLTPLLLEGALHLVDLELRHYSQSSAQTFYDSLSSQSESLRELMLQSEVDDDSERIANLVESICRLRKLTYLDLKNVSDFFRDEHIIVIASSLTQLEELWISGWCVTDAIFDALAGLHSLKRVDFNAYSEFTLEGILNYVSQLRLPGNQGQFLGIWMATPYKALSDNEQMIIRDAIRDKVDGRVEYGLARDPDAEESSESDSD